MTSTATLTRPVLSLEGVTKKFGDLTALNQVSLDLMPGQIHALLGANGSGKSTLVKIMSGVYQPDGGSLTLDGARLASLSSPAEAASRGVRVVHQEAPLIDSASVAEAVAIFRGFGTPAFGNIRWPKLRNKVQNLLDRMDVPVRADALCSTVGPADRAGLALAIVAGDLFDEKTADSPLVRLLIVDEVTAAIHESETGRHLDRLRAIADMGVAVVMVTHRLGELRVADDVTILRGGSLVYREDGGPRLSAGELVAGMIGNTAGTAEDAARDNAVISGQRAAELNELWRIAPASGPEKRPHAEEVVTVSNLVGGELRDCSFSARSGEIVGFAGLRGSGVEDLPRMLSGDLSWRSGTLSLDGVPVTTPGRPDRMIASGVTALAADRLRAGGVPGLSVAENIALPALGRYWRKSALHRKVVSSVIGAFDVRPPKPDATFGGLSGGNQQKVLLGKWLLLRPSVLVLGDPTHGVDPGARETIFEAVQDAARRGVCVLFFSTEPAQLTRICSRVLVLRAGEIVTELGGDDLTLENVVEWSEK
jgi:ribose transport system ATP-binding protein